MNYLKEAFIAATYIVTIIFAGALFISIAESRNPNFYSIMGFMMMVLIYYAGFYRHSTITERQNRKGEQDA